MRLLLASICLFAVTGVWAQAPKKTEWTKITSDKGKFELQFPGKPTQTGMQYLLEDGPTKVYLGIWNEIPKIDLTDKTVVAKMLDEARGSVETSLKGKVVKETDSKHQDKYPCRDITVGAGDLGIYRAKMVLTSTGFIQVVVLGPKEFVDGADPKKFLDSLKIKE